MFDDVDLVVQCYDAPPGLPDSPWSEVKAFEGVVVVPLLEELPQGLTVHDSIEPVGDDNVAPCAPGNHVVRARRLPMEDPPDTEGVERTIRWLVQLYPEPG